MRYSINVPNFGDFADPETFAEVARTVEVAGWDALPSSIPPALALVGW
jgi:hypothetical protein